MDVRNELAPSGKLRVGLNYGNFLLVLKDSADGSPNGIAPDLGRELGKRLGVPVEFVKFQQAGQLADGVRDGKCDVGFLGVEPQRATDIAFTRAYLEIPVTFLVPPGSKIGRIADVDRKGVRIAVSARSAYDLYLSRTLKNAELVRAEGIDGSHELFLKQKLDVLAGLKPRLVSDAEKLPGARVLEGQVTGVQQACGTTKARVAGAKYLGEFIEDVKRSGLVAKAIDRHGVKGVNVAP
ncbi:MAG TPA: ABC transporter substrate-binding protein [Burkholderiales bacterium]|nr:ABC transporter substrate-binding protein [Burkholderiales bacterium]